jgi:hypothetical protein
MSVDLSMIDVSLVLWLLAIVVILGLIFVVVRFFFHHLLHFVIRGCGTIMFFVFLLVILRILKVI